MGAWSEVLVVAGITYESTTRTTACPSSAPGRVLSEQMKASRRSPLFSLRGTYGAVLLYVESEMAAAAAAAAAAVSHAMLVVHSGDCARTRTHLRAVTARVDQYVYCPLQAEP